MQAIDRIKDRKKLLQLTQTSPPINPSIEYYQVPVTNTCANTLFSYLSSSISETMIPTLQHLEKERVWLIKEERCSSCKKRGYTAYDCPRKRKIATISERVIKDSNSQEKE